MKNNDLRAEIMKHGIYAYQVAATMGIRPNTLSHYLMADLSKPRKERIRQAIAKTAAEKDCINGEEKTK